MTAKVRVALAATSLFVLASAFAVPAQAARGGHKRPIARVVSAGLSHVRAPIMTNALTMRIGNPAAGGQCDGVSAIVDHKNKTVTLRFNDFTAQADANRRRDRAYCGAAIPIRLAKGVAATISQVDYRGGSYVPDDANAILGLESFAVLSSSGPVVKSISSPNFGEKKVLGPGQHAWTRCGGSQVLRFSATLNVETDASPVRASLAGSIVLHIQEKACP